MIQSATGPVCSRFGHKGQNPRRRRRGLNGIAPRRPSKKEAVCLCSRGGMRKCPRSVSNLSEGGQAAFSRRGKASQRRSSHGLRQLHEPVREHGLHVREEGKRKEENPKRSVLFRKKRAVSRVCLCPIWPPTIHTQAVQVHTPFHTSCNERARVCACVRVSQSSSSPPLVWEVSLRSGAVRRDGGLEPATSTTCVAPAWRTVDSGCAWWRSFYRRPWTPPQHFIGHAADVTFHWQHKVIQIIIIL